MPERASRTSAPTKLSQRPVAASPSSRPGGRRTAARPAISVMGANITPAAGGHHVELARPRERQRLARRRRTHSMSKAPAQRVSSSPAARLSGVRSQATTLAPASRGAPGRRCRSPPPHRASAGPRARRHASDQPQGRKSQTSATERSGRSRRAPRPRAPSTVRLPWPVLRPSTTSPSPSVAAALGRPGLRTGPPPTISQPATGPRRQLATPTSARGSSRGGPCARRARRSRRATTSASSIRSVMMPVGGDRARRVSIVIVSAKSSRRVGDRPAHVELGEHDLVGVDAPPGLSQIEMIVTAAALAGGAAARPAASPGSRPRRRSARRPRRR